MESKKCKIKLNSDGKLEELSQEIYDQYCRTINEIQNAINALVNSTNLGDENITMEEKGKYFKAYHDLCTDKMKALAGKTDIAKLMLEVIKHNGDAAAAVNDKNFAKRTSLNLADIKAAISGGDNETNTYNIKK